MNDSLPRFDFNWNNNIAEIDNIYFLNKPSSSGVGMNEIMSYTNLVEKKVGKKSIIDIGLSRLFGVMMVAGKEKDIDKFKQSQKFIHYKNELIKCLQKADFSQEVSEWIVNGDVGLSSTYLLSCSDYLYGCKKSHIYTMLIGEIRKSAPIDEQDRERTFKLIKIFPELEKTLKKLSLEDENWKKCYTIFLERREA
jgi:hypothetical protein